MGVNFPVNTVHKSTGADKVAADTKAMASEAFKAAAAFKSQGKEQKQAGEKAQTLLKRQQAIVRIMRSGNVNLKAAKAGTMAYSKSLMGATKEALAFAKSVDAADREIKQMTASQKRSSAATKSGSGVVRGITTNLLGMATAYVGVGAAIRQLEAGVAASVTLQGIDRTLRVATGSAEAGGDAFAFIRAESDRLGLSLGPTAKAFASFSAAAIGTDLAGEGVRDIFSAISEAGSVMSLSVEQQQGALLALGQMMSKGTVQAEELRGQLGERIPGAFGIFARALGVTTMELDGMLKKGEVLASDALPKFAAELRKTFGTDAQTRIETTAANMARFDTAVFDAQATLGDAFIPRMAEAAEATAKMLSQNKQLLEDFGELAGLVVSLSAKIGELASSVLGFVTGAKLLGRITDEIDDITGAASRSRKAVQEWQDAIASGDTRTITRGLADVDEQVSQLGARYEALTRMIKSTKDAQDNATKDSAPLTVLRDLKVAVDEYEEELAEVAAELRNAETFQANMNTALKTSTNDASDAADAADDLAKARKRQAKAAAEAAKREKALSDAFDEIEKKISRTKLTTQIMTTFGVSIEDAADAAGILSDSGFGIEMAGQTLEWISQLDIAQDRLDGLIDSEKDLLDAIKAVAAGTLDIRSVIPAVVNPSFVEGGFTPGLPTLDPSGRPISDAFTGGSAAPKQTDFQKLTEALEDLGINMDDLSGGLFSIGDQLTRGGQGLAGAVVNAAGVFASGGGVSGAIGTLLAGAAGTGGLGGQQGVSQFGGLTEGTFFQEGVTAGAQVAGAWGAIVGGFVGSFINKGADDLEGFLQEQGGLADINITLADPNLVDLGRQIEENIENALNQIQSSLIADLDLGAAGVSFDVRGNEFVVMAGTVRKTFNDVDEAMAFMILGVLAMNQGAENLSEEIRNLALASRGLETPNIEELQKGIDLALALDFEETGVNQAAIRAQEEQIKTAIRFNLTVEKVIALQRKRVAAEQAALRSQAASILGAEDFTTGILELTRTFEVFNNTSEAQVVAQESRRRVLEGLIATGEEHTAAMQNEADAATGATVDMGRFGKFFGVLADDSNDATSAIELTTGALIDSTHQLAQWQEEIDAINSSLEGRPDQFGQDEFAALWGNAVGKASLSMIGLIRVVEGGAAFAEEEKEIRRALFALQLAATISQAKILISTMEFVSDAMSELFQGVISAGEDALGKVLAGADLDFGGGRDGGRGRRKQDAEEAERSAESFRETVQGFREQLSGASANTLAWGDRVADFRDLASEAGIGTAELAEGLRLMAAVDLGALGEAWTTTARIFRQTDLEASFRAIGTNRRAAIEEARTLGAEDPEGSAAARAEIRDTTSRQFRALGRAALAGFMGPSQALERQTQETVAEITFMVDNLDRLGLTAQGVARTVRGQVLPGLLEMAAAEAERTGNDEEAARIRARIHEMEITFKLIELAQMEAMLIAAGAMTDGLQAMIDQTEVWIQAADAVGASTDSALGGAAFSGGGGLSSSRVTGFSGDLTALTDAINAFVRGFGQLDVGPFTTQANDWLNALSDFDRDVGRVLKALRPADLGLLRMASLQATGDVNAFLSGSADAIQGIIDFVKEKPAGSISRQVLDELELLLAQSGLAGTSAAGIASLLDQFSAPLEESLTPLQALDKTYADLINAMGLMGASQEDLIDAEQRFQGIRMMLIDESLDGIRGLQAEIEGDILKGRAPREQVIAARGAFEQAAAGLDVEDPSSIAAFEQAARAWRDIVGSFDASLASFGAGSGSLVSNTDAAILAAIAGILPGGGMSTGAASFSAESLPGGMTSTLSGGLPLPGGPSFAPSFSSPGQASPAFLAEQKRTTEEIVRLREEVNGLMVEVKGDPRQKQAFHDSINRIANSDMVRG